MDQHESNISKSIDLNIIGTANLVKVCQKYKIKIIYFYKLRIRVFKRKLQRNRWSQPINNYGLSKMGGEASS